MKKDITRDEDIRNFAIISIEFPVGVARNTFCSYAVIDVTSPGVKDP